VGEKVKILLWREGENQEIEVTLRERTE